MPGPDDHKYSRGYVAVLSGEMPGAAALAASAALRAGAGYVRLAGAATACEVPQAVVRGGDVDVVADGRIGALVIGPGLGRASQAQQLLDGALASGRPLVLDADALFLLASLPMDRIEDAILTPHAGEFEHLFGSSGGDKIARVRAAASRTGSVIVFKGPDTIVAAPDGRAAIAGPGPAWLATAGTGDVLSGVIAAMRASGKDAYDAARAGVWLHGRAASIAGPGLIADDLIAALRPALAECL